ncbi:pyridoxal phosphate-dependent transferase [Xylogone sp. PMI_703]|nr:pyridoxal phosphate-dependent transferase [Xylogone sp. PMI_703]
MTRALTFSRLPPQALQLLNKFSMFPLLLRTFAVDYPSLLFAIQLFRNLIFSVFVFRSGRKLVRQLKGRGIIGTVIETNRKVRSYLFGIFLRIPAVRAKVQQQLEEATGKLQSRLVQSGPDVIQYLDLPKKGWSRETVLAELQELATMKHTRWEDGCVSGAVYHGGADLLELQKEAYGKFTIANPIHPDVFPGVRKMEAEIVAMVLKLFNAPSDAAGVTTSGGTESILMACLSARNKAYAERGITEPEMIASETAHPAFRKAAQYFGFKLHLVDSPAPDHQVDIRAVRRLINSNTAIIVGSAPNYPHGIIDDIEALSKLAFKYRIPLHVDCCLGSFVVAFLEKCNYPCPLFDFRLPGVTSISCDTHKYGFAPKGSSTVLYRNHTLRSYQYFVVPDWSGGLYCSPSMAGSRPGSLIAGCWASMMNMGEDGYMASCKEIITTTRQITSSIRQIPDLSIIGNPIVSVVAFTSQTLDIYDIADAMSAKGWHLNSLQTPPGIHVAVTMPIVRAWGSLITDLKETVEEEKAKEAQRTAEGKDAKGKNMGDNAALYGVAGTLPNKSIVADIAIAFLDTLYKT